MPVPPVVQRWTRRPGATGWLRVRLEPDGAPEYLCEYTRVVVLGAKAGRTHFRITEGRRSVGRTASMGTANADRYLSARPPGGSATVVVKYLGKPVEALSTIRNQKLVQQWAQLSFDGQTARVTLNSEWGGAFTPIKKGVHAILAPDRSHANIDTGGYAQAAPGTVGDDTWFPIGIDGSVQPGDRYIHIGHLSHGCVTLYELGKWTALYNYLISRRVAGSRGLRIGRLVVQ